MKIELPRFEPSCVHSRTSGHSPGHQWWTGTFQCQETTGTRIGMRTIGGSCRRIQLRCSGLTCITRSSRLWRGSTEMRRPIWSVSICRSAWAGLLWRGSTGIRLPTWSVSICRRAWAGILWRGLIEMRRPTWSVNVCRKAWAEPFDNCEYSVPSMKRYVPVTSLWYCV